MPPTEQDAPAATRGVRAPSPRPSASSNRARLLSGLVSTLRPGQWPKSLVVLVPLLQVSEPRGPDVARAALAALTFTLASCVVYVVNDVVDRGRDRLHPEKRHRPIAAGRVGPAAALGAAAGLATALAALLAVQGPVVSWPVLAYVALNLAYSGWLKHVPLVDVFAVAGGFVLRLLGGAAAVHVRPSGWLVLSVLFACLVLVLGKRRHELHASGNGHRPALDGYTVHYLDVLLMLCGGLTAVSYLLFASAYGALTLSLTAPCAVYALFRYLHVVFVGSGAGNPVRALLRDRAMVANGALWLVLIEGSRFYG